MPDKSRKTKREHRIEGEPRKQKELTSRVWEISQYLAEPWTGKWRKDRRTLRKNVNPLINEDQIIEGLDHKTIARWCYVLHDEDVYTDGDEQHDETGRIRAGDPKFAHYHIYIELTQLLPVSTIARWFGVPEQYVEKKYGRRGVKYKGNAFLDCAEYAMHESPRAVEQGKTPYPAERIVCSPNFDIRAEVDAWRAWQTEHPDLLYSDKPVDRMRYNVLKNGWSLERCANEDPMTYAKLRGSLQALRLDYFQMFATPPSNRFTLFIDGDSGMGKTSLSRYLSEFYAQPFDGSYFEIKKGAKGKDNVVFLGYDGQPVILWNEVRAADFIAWFGANVNDVWEPHPGKMGFDVKNSAVVLANAYNIINAAQPWAEFLGEMVNYFVKLGEDEVQVYRRICAAVHVEKDVYEILVNMGYVDEELYGWKQFTKFKRVGANIKETMKRLGGDAQRAVMLNIAKPVMETTDYLLEVASENRIVDVDAIPEEFVDYGKVTTAEELAVEEQARLYEKWEAEAELFGVYHMYLDEYEDCLRWDAAMPDGYTRGWWCQAFEQEDRVTFDGRDLCKYAWDVEALWQYTKPDEHDLPLSFSQWRVAFGCAERDEAGYLVRSIYD